jgi:hypothetical protein
MMINFYNIQRDHVDNVINNPEPDAPGPIDLIEIYQEQVIDRSIKSAGQLVCRLCRGPVVDLRNGEIHCGRNVPQEVTKSNEKLENN